MSKIPVLTDNQSERLKHLLSQNRIDLTNAGGGKMTRLPTMPEEGDIIIGSGYNGPFAVSTVDTSMVTISTNASGEEIITIDSMGSVTAAIVNVKEGFISERDSQYKVNESSSIILPEDYSLYYVQYNNQHRVPEGGYYNRIPGSGIPYNYDSYVVLQNDQYAEDQNKVAGYKNYTKIAVNRGGVVSQIQYGAIADLSPSSCTYTGPFAIYLRPGIDIHMELVSTVSPDGNSFSGYISGGTEYDPVVISNGTATFRVGVSGGMVVQGSSAFSVAGTVRSISVPLNASSYAGVDVYLYSPESGVYSLGFLPYDEEHPHSIFGDVFYKKIGEAYAKYAFTFSSGGIVKDFHSSGTIQRQYGDVVDVDVGGSTIYSSSIYSSTIVHSSSITSDIYSSTIVQSSSIYSSTINITSTINSSSIALEYKGHFCVSGGIQSAGTPQEAFIATVYDGTNPNGNVAGEVIVGNTASLAGTSSIICPIGSSVYLIGTVNGNSVSVQYSAYANDPTVQANQFYTQLACNSGGTMTQMQYGDIVQPVKGGGGGVTGIEAAFVDETPAAIVTGGTGAVKFEGEGTVQVSLKARRYATQAEIEDWGRRYNPATGEMDGDYKNAGWRGIITLENGDVMTEYSVSDYIDGVEVGYPLIVPDTTDEELEIIAQAILQNDDSLITQTIEDKAYLWASSRIADNKSPFYNGDSSDEQYRVVEDDTILIKGSTQGGGGGEGGWIPYWRFAANSYDTTHSQTIVELYTRNGYSSQGYIVDSGSFTPSFDCEVVAFAELKSTGDTASVHIVVNGAYFKVCSVQAEGSVTVGQGTTVRVRAGQSINIQIISGTNSEVKNIGMICYENGLDNRFVPE